MYNLQCLSFYSKIRCLCKQLFHDTRQFSRMFSAGNPDSSQWGQRPRNG